MVPFFQGSWGKGEGRKATPPPSVKLPLKLQSDPYFALGSPSFSQIPQQGSPNIKGFG